jgi:hypothetical protein
VTALSYSKIPLCLSSLEMEPLRYGDGTYAESDSFIKPSGASKSRNAPRREIPHGIRVALRIASMIASLAVAGLLVHTVVTQHITRNQKFTYPHGTEFSAWPKTLKLGPTYLMLGAGLFAGVLNLIALIALCGCVSHLKHVRNLL